MPDSFQNPIGGGPKDPFEKYRIEKIEKDKDRDAEKKMMRWGEGKPHSAFAAYFLLLFKKILDLFENTTERGLGVSAEIDVQEHLTLLKAAIETLKAEDHSQDVAFLNRLSSLWHQILEDLLRFRKKTALANHMNAFIKSVQSYPEGKEHSFAYYLSEYAGQTWLPFPYMEMLKQLWAEHQKLHEGSHLHQWSSTLKEMIQMLDPEKSKDPDSP